MGRSGARTGFKVYSINTTIRNPKRNADFLKLFKKYDKLVMDNINTYKYFFYLVQNGIYTFTNIPISVKEKLELGIELSDDEVIDAIEKNPQATGLHGRVMTQLRALKDQGFLRFEKAARGQNKITITKLGHEIIDNEIDGTITYTKAMIGLHAKNPARSSMLNESVPFLNTLFVINEVNKEWRNMGHEPKGILRHEFGTFVLSMKDCDYKRAANDIIEYRKRNRYKINEKDIINHLNKNDILELKMNSVIADYPDDVFRKFEMTGLLVARGQFGYRYIDFSKYNMEKVKIILEDYKNYSFKHFTTEDDYYFYLENIKIPWEKDELIRRKVIESKCDVLGLKFDEKLDLTSQEQMLDQMFYRKALDNAIKDIELELIKQELKILAGTSDAETKFGDLGEPLRLEYLLALLLGKIYGTSKLVSNIIYAENGKPLHYAPAGKSDIILYDEKGSYILEPTMQKGRNQQLNNETTNIVRHVEIEKEKSGLDFRVLMIAPVIHIDVTRFFKYMVVSEDAKIIPASIERSTQLFIDNSQIESLNRDFDNLVEHMKETDLKVFVDEMNAYRMP